MTGITTRDNNVITKETSYTYDNNGNQLTTTVKTYDGSTDSSANGGTGGGTAPSVMAETNEYDCHNQLIQTILSDGTIVSNVYNGEGYRVGKEVGNILESGGEVDNNIRYSGCQYDEETDRYYLNARMYDPKTAGFLQEDTYTGDSNDPLSLNLMVLLV